MSGNIFDKVRDTMTDDGKLIRQSAFYLIIYKDNKVIHAGHKAVQKENMLKFGFGMGKRFYSSISKIQSSLTTRRKLNIRDYVKVNFFNKNKPLPEYNFWFLKKYCFYVIKHNNVYIFDYENGDSKLLFSYWVHFYLNLYINNNNIKNNKYLWFLSNTPTHWIITTIEKEIRLFSTCYYQKYFSVNQLPREFFCYDDRYKYALISFWHKLGKELYLSFFKFLYDQYTLHFIEIANLGYEYTKFKIGDYVPELQEMKLDYFLSFVEFKNILIKESSDLDVEDYVKYGKDMYNFFSFYRFIFKNFNTSTINKCNNLSIVLKLNMFYRSGFYLNTSKNHMNKEIVNINMDNIDIINLTTSYNIHKPSNINYKEFSMKKTYWSNKKKPLSYHERIAKFNNVVKDNNKIDLIASIERDDNED